MNVYEMMTDRIIGQLEKGTIPWQQPWEGGIPKNLLSGKNYRGVNVFLLASAGYRLPYWLTFKQAASRGGRVRKGERGLQIVFWLWPEEEEAAVDKLPQKEDPSAAETESLEKGRDNSQKDRRPPILRYYTVFNAVQCEGIEVPAIPRRTFEPLVACERVVRLMPNPPQIKHGGTHAFYTPLLDTIQLPQREQFCSPEAYYSTLFHELSHSTGHERRLKRFGSMDNHLLGIESYSKEELVAEMGAAFLCGMTGIEKKTIENTAAYIDSWLQLFRKDKRMLLVAAAQAQKAVDYILNIQIQNKPENT